jgi:prepilin-type N-terminal cleavage/methylation domain-containing protein
MRRDGFTLIEVLTASALLTAALAMIWSVWISANDTADVLGRKANATDATVHAMTVITRELRAIALNELSALPAEELHYRVPEDLDGNGLPVDAQGNPEWGTPRRIGRDHADINGDGFTDSQLVLEKDGSVDVLATGLTPTGDADPGIWFERRGDSIQVTLAVSSASRRGLPVSARAVQCVTPRNP